MKPEPPLKRTTQPSINVAPLVDAAIQKQALALAAELQRRAKSAQADRRPGVEAPCDLIKGQLDAKRQELQAQLDIGAELKHWLKVLETITPPAPNELRVRVLILQGSVYDFTRMGKASHRERLDRALHNAAQIFKTHWDTVVVFGQPEVIERGTGAWELTPDELWRLEDTCTSAGTPALLFADRILLPDERLPHSWGRPDRSIACVAESEWLNEGTGFITTHNLAHLLGLDDQQQGPHLMTHDELHLQLSRSEIEQLRQRVAARAARWAEENAAARQQSENMLDLAQHTAALLEQQGDLLWQLYQVCTERDKNTPPYGVAPMPETRPPSAALSDLARQVELLTQRVTRAEQELATAKMMLSEVEARLRELGSKTGA